MLNNPNNQNASIFRNDSGLSTKAWSISKGRITSDGDHLARTEDYRMRIKPTLHQADLYILPVSFRIKYDLGFLGELFRQWTVDFKSLTICQEFLDPNTFVHFNTHNSTAHRK